MAQKDLGIVTAYGYAKQNGYTGTEEEFAELLSILPNLPLDATAAAGTVDGDLYRAIVALGWQGEVISNGAVETKKTFTKLMQMFAVTKTTFTPTKGTAYVVYGGCYYERYGRFVHLHLGLSGLTANSVNVVYYLPDGIKPTNRIFSAGTSGDITAAVYVEVTEEGKVSAVPLKAYCGADVYWIL